MSDSEVRTAPIELNLKTMLPTIREAFDNKTLQMFNVNPGDWRCMYSGPCAIGVCIPEDRREELDRNDSTTIDGLIKRGLVSAPEEQHGDLSGLQMYHDMVVTEVNNERTTSSIEIFGAFLLDLEKKYAE